MFTGGDAGDGRVSNGHGQRNVGREKRRQGLEVCAASPVRGRELVGVDGSGAISGNPTAYLTIRVTTCPPSPSDSLLRRSSRQLLRIMTSRTPPSFSTECSSPIVTSHAPHKPRGVEPHLIESLYRPVHLETDDEECESGDATEGAEEDRERGKVALGGGGGSERVRGRCR